MKRLVSVTVILLMLCGVAFASVVDFATMSTDDLILLRQQISDEIKKRTNDADSILPKGVYVVGKDIKAGRYVLTMLPYEYGTVLIIETEERYLEVLAKLNSNDMSDESNEGRVFETYVSRDEQAYFSLKEGQVLITQGTGILSVNKPSWAP